MLRVLWPTDFLFRLDEAEHFEYSLRMSRDGEWLRHAWPSSVGVPNGPGFVWFLAAITRFTLDPVLGTLAIAATNVVALALAIPLLRELLGDRREANLAIALLATNPVAIWFSRKLWDPGLLPILTVPALWLALRTIRGRGSWALAGMLPLLAFAAQVHQSAVFLAVAVLGVVASRWRRLGVGPLLVGIAGSVAVLAPYVSYLLAEVVGKPGALRPTSGSAWPDVDVITNLFLDLSGHNIIQSAGTETGRLLLWPVPPAWLLVQLAAIPLLVYAVAGYAEAWRGKAWRGKAGGGEASRGEAAGGPGGARRLLLGVGIGLPALFLALRVRGVAHYYLGALPLLVALLPLGARRAAHFPARWRRWLLPIPVLVGVQALSWLGFQSYMSAHYGSDRYGLPYGRVLQAGQEVAARAAALGRGGPEAPLRLAVDVPFDRGTVPAQYAFVFRHRLDLAVRPPEEGETADLVLRVRWPKAGRLAEPPWEIVAGPGSR